MFTRRLLEFWFFDIYTHLWHSNGKVIDLIKTIALNFDKVLFLFHLYHCKFSIESSGRGFCELPFFKYWSLDHQNPWLFYLPFFVSFFSIKIILSEDGSLSGVAGSLIRFFKLVLKYFGKIIFTSGC